MIGYVTENPPEVTLGNGSTHPLCAIESLRHQMGLYIDKPNIQQLHTWLCSNPGLTPELCGMGGQTFRDSLRAAMSDTQIWLQSNNLGGSRTLFGALGRIENAAGKLETYFFFGGVA